MQTAQPARPAINPRLIAPFVEAVKEVMLVMVGVKTTVERPFLKADPVPLYDVSSIIGFSGEVTGCVVTSFQLQAAEKLATAFAGTPIDAGHADFADALGELANMIAGSGKKRLGLLASITVPSVIIGAGHSVARLSDVPCVVIPCKTPAGDFAVEVSVKETPAA